MKTPIRLAPSILAADFSRLGEQALEAERAGADRLHLDIMDGHFVPNITFGPAVVQAVRRVTQLPLETHLMISEPERHVEAFAAAGSTSLLVHVEGTLHLHRLIQQIKALGCQAGVVLNPATPASALDAVLADVDLVLAMTVNPGFGGQAFIESTLPKIAEIRRKIDQFNPRCELEVDGGIDSVTAPRTVAAGANVLVAGTAIFGAKDGVAAALARLKASVTA